MICDRFIDSTRVYQGLQGRVDPKLIDSLEWMAVGDLRPDLTLMLDLPPEVGLARARARRSADGVADRFEREALAFHQGLRSGFLAIAAREPERCRVIDATGRPEAVAEAIWTTVGERFPALLQRVTLPSRVTS